MQDNEILPRRLRHVVNPVLLALLLCADVVFLLVHALNEWWPAWLPSSNELLALDKDGGYAEVFQYIKEYWIAIALFAMYWRTRETIYGAWALFFTYLLCDDALAIHEVVGRAVARQWGYVPALGLRARDFGELTILAFVGAALLVSITFTHRRGSRYARTVSMDLVWLSGVLVFFGVVVDMVHSAVGVLAGGLTVIDEGGIILEEVGEMVTMSFITGYVVHLLEGQGHRPGLPGASTLTAFGRRCRRRAGAWTSGHRARPAGEDDRRP